MSRCSGKTVKMIRLAAENDAAILVSNDARAEDIIAKAIRLGLKPPNVIVMARGQDKGITVAGAIVDNQDYLCRPAVTLRCELEQTSLLNYQSFVDAIRKMKANEPPKGE